MFLRLRSCRIRCVPGEFVSPILPIGRLRLACGAWSDQQDGTETSLTRNSRALLGPVTYSHDYFPEPLAPLPVVAATRGLDVGGEVAERGDAERKPLACRRYWDPRRV